MFAENVTTRLRGLDKPKKGWVWVANFICLLIPTSWLKVFIDVPLPILWYAKNLHGTLLISGMPWSTIEAPQ